MKNKSIKEYVFRVKNKGKTVGRPSKREMLASSILDYIWKHKFKSVLEAISALNKGKENGKN